uniref:Uncharacterized protein n=1 Tax=Oryza punctata TaxID=4537 RepID=A0A0E0K4B3_ORYPU
MVKAVLSSIPIYLLVGVDPPKWIIKEVDKSQFRWAGRANAQSGYRRVYDQTNFGDLVTLNL